MEINNHNLRMIIYIPTIINKKKYNFFFENNLNIIKINFIKQYY